MTTKLTKAFIIAHVPPGLEQALLQHIRDFDTAHPGCHFEVGLEPPNISLPEMIELLRVTPGLTFHEIIQRRRASEQT